MVSAQRAEVLRHIGTATDEEVLEEFDELVANAVQGDLRAIGAIAVVFGPALLKEARRELARSGCEDDAADVLQNVFVAMTEGSLTFPGERGTGLEWMKRVVREAARRTANNALRFGAVQE